MTAMTFDEVAALLKQPPSMERTSFYIEKRGCWTYRPFGGQTIDALPAHMKDHQRSCFNCGQRQPEYAGRCWGNMICEIWVCESCAPKVEDTRSAGRAAVGDHPEDAVEHSE